ncbi:hypothetical protein CDL12_30373 [Handroanthus impetiginosus]|uniref:DUF761 domain-containing protein n=1 Tax=Handroanthus impetiginosus TaxID=429701 RepID=A0A2G9FWU5_9LAMI|nr:hypothetical protein CDL12_30373 [Handroanthus impetiginosus]
MAVPSSLKALNSIHVKPPSSSSSSSSLNSMKLKTLLQTFIFSHMYRIARALAKAKSVLIQLLKDIHFVHFIEFPLRKNKNNKQKKLFFGSFRLYYNWCSSYSNSHVYYDSNWKSAVPTTSFDYNVMEDEPNELSKYLEWLEEKGHHDEDAAINEIDKLADLFIANCHEKFRLEKQESYRRFQEMMARSV